MRKEGVPEKIGLSPTYVTDGHTETCNITGGSFSKVAFFAVGPYVKFLSVVQSGDMALWKIPH